MSLAEGNQEARVFKARNKSFTRRSRELQGSLARTLEREGHRFVLPVERESGETTIAQDSSFDPEATFGRDAALVVEVGSGGGEQIVAAAKDNPDRNYLAFEVWPAGIAKMVSRAANADVDNLRIIEVDATLAVPVLLDTASVTEFWTFFPDPWRKARHRKRRLVATPFAAEVARALKDGGTWRLATDWDDYAWQMRDVVEAEPSFTNPHAGERPDPADPEPSKGGFAPRFEGRVLTRFEQRGIEAGRSIHDLVALRRSR